MAIKKGDKVITLVEKLAYGYAGTYVGKGSVGIVVAINIPCFCLRLTCKCKTFMFVDFPLVLGERIRKSYHKHEVKKVRG